MNEIKKIKESMTSLEIAEITGKEHKTVMRDIRNLIENLKEINGYRFVLVEYQDKKGEMRPMYELGKKECLLLASGYDVALRAKIINRWEELERQTNKIASSANLEDDEHLKLRKAELLSHLADTGSFLPKYATVLNTYAANILIGNKAIPLPISEKKRYTAAEVGKELGITSKKVGRIANSYNLKTPEFGEWVEDTAKYNKGKQVRNFEYFENAIQEIRNHIA